MLKRPVIHLLIASLVFLSGSAFVTKHVDTYQVDTASSSVEWFAEKVTGKHHGNIKIKSGVLHNNHGRFSGKIIMDMSTISVQDLSGESKGKLERHLHSDDFFSVTKHPSSEFEITSITPRSGIAENEPNFNVQGRLTIKGITHDLTFPAYIRFEGRNMTATGEAVVDRTKYDIKYRSKTFFQDIGDKAIYDEFRLKFSLKASM
jgi:polyisoprenoid-binding protein YceI